MNRKQEKQRNNSQRKMSNKVMVALALTTPSMTSLPLPEEKGRTAKGRVCKKPLTSRATPHGPRCLKVNVR